MSDGSRVLVCFDVDGTLWTSNGPIPERLLDWLLGQGCGVAIVSPSSAAPPDFMKFIAGPARSDNLNAARAAHPECDILWYVSDNGDVAEAEAAGFRYIDCLDFKPKIKGVRYV